MPSDTEQRLRELEYRFLRLEEEFDKGEDRIGAFVDEVLRERTLFDTPESCANICVTVTNVGTSAPMPGATLTVSQSGFTIGAANTDAAGNTCVLVPLAGDYDIAVSSPGCTTHTDSVTIVCGTDQHLDIALSCFACTSATVLHVAVKTCDNQPYLSQPVRLTGPGGYDVTMTTGGSGLFAGIASWILTGPGAGTYTATCAGDSARFTSTSIMIVVPCNVTTNATLKMQAASGYACWVGCKYPLPAHLQIQLIPLSGGPICSFDYDATAGGWIGCNMRLLGNVYPATQAGLCSGTPADRISGEFYFLPTGPFTLLQTWYGFCSIGPAAASVQTTCGVTVFNPPAPGPGWVSQNHSLEVHSCIPVDLKSVSGSTILWQITEP